MRAQQGGRAQAGQTGEDIDGCRAGTGIVGAGFRGGGRGVQLRQAEGQKCGDEGHDARWGERKSE